MQRRKREIREAQHFRVHTLTYTMSTAGVPHDLREFLSRDDSLQQRR